jgi:CHAD domain-containing protein
LRAANDPAGGRIHLELLRRQESFARKIPALRRTVRQMLSSSQEAIGSWPLAKTTPQTLVAGLKRVYKQGRSAFKIAVKNPGPEHLHEWRKKAKALGFGFELIERLGPKELSKRKRFCQTLGDMLGEDHDLFMVLQVLGRAHQARPARDYAELARRISAKRAKLEKKAFKLGQAVYSEKPRAFAKRMDRHLGGDGKLKSKKK